jgi:hypothetical protein
MILHPIISALIAAILTVGGVIQLSHGALGWAAVSLIIAAVSAFSAYRGWRVRRAWARRRNEL